MPRCTATNSSARSQRTSIETTRRTLISVALALAAFMPAAHAADPALVTIGVTNASSDVTFYNADKMGFFAQGE
jgi:ABC-type sugar transport system substrate-binding protein